MPKVLIFESDSEFADELRLGLEQHACSVTVVGDATEGLQVAANDRPDLVLLTVELPRINGFSVCNKLKRDPGLKSVPLIIMSSDSNEDTFSQHRRLKHSRAEDYVHKPVSFAELLPRIRSLVSLPDATESPDEVVRIHEAPARVDSYLELDDDLEELDSEDTELDGEFDAELEEVESIPPEASVDAEVDEFTEHAFDAMLDEDLLATQNDEDPDTKVDATRRIFPPSGAPVPPTSPYPIPVAVTQRPSAMDPPRSRPPSTMTSDLAPPRLSVSEALAAIDPVLMAEKDQAIADLEGLLGQANAEVERHKADVLRLSGEMEQVRKDLESSRSDWAGAGSAQDFLTLREALNKKEREILDLHGQLSQKSKDLLAIKDTSLGHEREKTDAIDRALQAEREAHEQNRMLNATKADKEQAAKRADDFKRRADKLMSEAQEKDQAVAQLRVELEAAEARARKLLAELTEQADQRLARAEESARVALAEAGERLTAVEESGRLALAEADRRVSAAEDNAKKALADAMEQAAAQLVRAEESQRVALTEASQRTEERLAAAEREKQSALAQATEHAEARLTRAVDAMRADAERRLGEALEHERLTAERTKVAALEHQEARLRTEYEQAFAMLAEEKANAYSALERDRDAAIARAEQEIGSARGIARDLTKDLAALQRELEVSREALAAVRAELEHERAQLGTTKSDLSALVSQLETTRRELGSANGELATRSTELASVEHQLSLTRSELVATRSDLSSTLSDLGVARGRVERLELELNETTGELSVSRTDLLQLQQEFARVQATASAALSKWEQDRDAIHKGREALQSALEQLTQIENRPLN